MLMIYKLRQRMQFSSNDEPTGLSLSSRALPITFDFIKLRNTLISIYLIDLN